MAESMTGPILGVGAIVVRDGTLLMVRRATDPARGMWSVPGGKVEPGEQLVVAVTREVEEETGLTVEVGELAGIFEVISEWPGDGHYVILDYFAQVRGDPQPHPAGDASEAAWVPFDEIDGLECTPRLVETLRRWSVL